MAAGARGGQRRPVPRFRTGARGRPPAPPFAALSPRRGGPAPGGRPANGGARGRAGRGGAAGLRPATQSRPSEAVSALQLSAGTGLRDDDAAAERGSASAGREPCRPSGNAELAAAPAPSPAARGNGWWASMRSCSREGRGRRSSQSARARFSPSARARCVGAEFGAQARSPPTVGAVVERPRVSADSAARSPAASPARVAAVPELCLRLSGTAGGESRSRASPTASAAGSGCGAGCAAGRRWGSAGGRPRAAVSLQRRCSVPLSDPNLG